VPLTERSLGLCITADPVCEGHTSVHIILISAFSEYRPPLHIYILTIKQVQLANMEPIPLDDPISGHRSLNAIVLWDKVDSWSNNGICLHC